MSTIHKEPKTSSKAQYDDNDVDTVDDIDLNDTAPTTGAKQPAESKSNDEITVKQLDATQMYLGEIGFSPLLTAEEEVKFSREALRGNEKSRSYFK